MNLYAESSAILAWLFGEANAPPVKRALRRAEIIVASDLTLVECERVIVRAQFLGEITTRRADACRGRLIEASTNWYMLRMGPDILQRARKPFHGEPVRTLDALHLASALIGRTAVPDLQILSLDERVRRSASELEFSVLPL